jgi:surface polysaccharide O-acyltransferase-like enzyme
MKQVLKEQNPAYRSAFLYFLVIQHHCNLYRITNKKQLHPQDYFIIFPSINTASIKSVPKA